MSPSFVVSWSKKQVEEWQIANKRNLNVQSTGENRPMNNHKCKPPEVDQLKINVDASVVVGQESFAVGMVLRNHQGQFIAGKTMRFAGEVPVLETEITGIWEAILWAQEMAGVHITVESDSLLSVNAINQGHDNLLESGDIMQQCQEVIRSNDRISVSHIKKQTNKVAHNLARLPCELNRFVEISSPPSCLLETILSDALML